MTAPQNRDLPTLHEGEYWIQPLKIPRLDNHKVTLLSAHFGSPSPNPKRAGSALVVGFFKSGASDAILHPPDRDFDSGRNRHHSTTTMIHRKR